MRTSRVLLGLVLGRRLPQRDGVLQVDGAAGELVIGRDRWGVPMVIDVGDWQNCRWAVPGGQSGNPASRIMTISSLDTRWLTPAVIHPPWVIHRIPGAA